MGGISVRPRPGVDSEIVDDFVAASAPEFNKYLQSSTKPKQVIIMQVLENRPLVLL
jgi:hypothetical protein